MTAFLSPVFAVANQELIKMLVAAFAMVIVAIMKLASARREEIEKAKASMKAPVRPKTPDARFRNEIEVFLEEVGRRRPGNSPAMQPAADREPSRDPSRSDPNRDPNREPATLGRAKVRNTQPPAQAQVRPRGPSGAHGREATNRTRLEPPKPAPPAAAPAPRPGAELAARKSPASKDLGKDVRAHLTQYLDESRLSKTVQSDLGNAVEVSLRARLGDTITQGVGQGDIALALAGEHSIVALLRKPAGVRSAVLINEILARPKSLRRKN
jgi:hypothetical protein